MWRRLSLRPDRVSCRVCVPGFGGAVPHGNEVEALEPFGPGQFCFLAPLELAADVSVIAFRGQDLGKVGGMGETLRPRACAIGPDCASTVGRPKFRQTKAVQGLHGGLTRPSPPAGPASPWWWGSFPDSFVDGLA